MRLFKRPSNCLDQPQAIDNPVPTRAVQVHPEICGARQNACCERQDALYVEFIELAGVTVYSSERELLASFLRVPVVRLDVDRAFEEERLVETNPLGTSRTRCTPQAPRVGG
jgi:hypothetical protein